MSTPPTTMSQCSILDLQYQQTMTSYNAMISAANQFIAFGNLLADNPNFSIASTAFKTWGAAVLTEVTTFVQNTPIPPSP